MSMGTKFLLGIISIILAIAWCYIFKVDVNITWGPLFEKVASYIVVGVTILIVLVLGLNAIFSSFEEQYQPFEKRESNKNKGGR